VHTGLPKFSRRLLGSSRVGLLCGAVDDRWPRRIADHLTVVLAQTPQSFTEDDRSHAPSAGHLTRRRERVAGIHGLSIDTIELCERNMIDELAPRLVHELPVGS
jgi:hypothetical protein